MVSTDQAWSWSLEIRTQRIFNNLIKPNQKLGSDPVLQQSTNDSVQGPESRVQSPASRVQGPASRAQFPESSVQLLRPKSRNPVCLNIMGL